MASLSQASQASFLQEDLLTSFLCFHILVMITVFQTFQYYYTCYDDHWSMIFDVIIAVVLGCHLPCPYKTVSLLYKCPLCSDCFSERPFPCPSPCLWASLFWDTTILRLGQLTTLIMASGCSCERKSHTSLTLNQKLEVIKLREEDMSNSG